MNGSYRNIFTYYRGSLQREQDREQQLEDNTTKALVNTLENCDPNVSDQFLEWLGISPSGTTSFVLQKSTIGEGAICRKEHRLLLAIVGTGKEKNQAICGQLPEISNGDSRPDAWLYGDDFVVLLESKTGNATLELNQMACHWHKLNPTCREVRILTWAEVHHFFVTLAPSLDDNTRSRWLVEQFTQYLEWTGMTEFVGFKKEMFEFFVAPERDPDAKKWVRGAVDGLAEKLLHGEQGLKHFSAFYVEKHVGNLAEKSDHYWAAFGPSNFRKYAHQTISLGEQELYVFVNIELLPVIKKLRKKIGSGFRQVMCDIPAPYTVRISERKQKQVQLYDSNRIAEVQTGIYEGVRYGLTDSDSTGFEYLEKLLLNITYPDLTVGRSFSRQQVLELSEPNGERLVAEVLKTQKELHRLVKFIND